MDKRMDIFAGWLAGTMDGKRASGRRIDLEIRISGEANDTVNYTESEQTLVMLLSTSCQAWLTLLLNISLAGCGGLDWL